MHEFIQRILPFSIEDELLTKVPAEVTIGQAILESNWGRSKLAVLANNLFGIKADKRWHGETLNLPGFEYINGKRINEMMSWRKYPSILEGIADHSRFLKQTRYLDAYKTDNWKDFIRAIHKAGYATDEYYSEKLIKLMTPDILHCIAEARKKPNV